jgi:transcriptional regulator with XRE-family HTH domain
MDQDDSVCSPCRRAGRVPDGLPDGFWDRDDVLAAATDRDFGQLLLAIRQASRPPIKQADMAVRLGITQSQVSRIERGSTAIRDLDKLERWALELDIPPERLWFTLPAPPDRSPSKDSTSAAAVGDGNPVHRRQFVKYTGIVAAAGLATSLSRTPMNNGTGGPVANIGDPEVDLVREVSAAFRKVDNKHGGGHSRSAVNNYLTATVGPMLAGGKMRETIRHDLFAAAAELHQLAGWMSYDIGRVDEGRLQLRTALRLCQEAGDDAMSAEMLAGMSHQAAFHQAPDFALDLALAAKQSARRSGITALQTEAVAMEAHALAMLGDRELSMAALTEAEQLSTRMGGDVPGWLQYFDSAYLAAKFAHTFHKLGDLRSAETFAWRSLEMSDDFQRGRMFNTALLATVLADMGRVEEACQIGKGAVDLAAGIRSTRSIAYLGDLSRSLTPYSHTREVRALDIRFRDLGI